MSKIKQLLSGGLLAATMLLATQGLEAFCPKSYIDVAGGWRRDEVNRHFGLTAVTTAPTPDTFDIRNKTRQLNIWQVGVEGRYSLPENLFGNNGCCNSGLFSGSWLNGIFIEGYAYWGWVTSGNFENDATESGIVIDSTRVKERNGHTYDYSIGAGWLYPVTCEFAIGPVVGYSWDRIQFKTNRGSAHATTKWTSPWLGFEADYEMCDWFFDAGYKYHWTRERGSLVIPAASVDLSSTHTNNSKHGQGHEAFVDAWYAWNDCWDIGLGFQYRHFQTSHQFITGTIGGDDVVGPAKTTWKSYAINLKLAYNF